MTVSENELNIPLAKSTKSKITAPSRRKMKSATPKSIASSTRGDARFLLKTLFRSRIAAIIVPSFALFAYIKYLEVFYFKNALPPNSQTIPDPAYVLHVSACIHSIAITSK